jgi:HSP20 family protein
MNLSSLAPFRSRPPARNGGQSQREEYLQPFYRLIESADGYGLEVFVPGAAKEGIDLQVEQGELVITARRTWTRPEGWTELYRETADAAYRLRLELTDAIDADGIRAGLEQGVLRVTLPKPEARKPRKIEIQ